GVQTPVIQGTSVDDLRQGPGHYLSTPLPGAVGNVGIAGHRTTYGAPFGRLDELAVGDIITVRAVTGTWIYRVFDTLVVQPGSTDVLMVDPAYPTMLTLTTEHPKFSNAQELVVRAALDCSGT